MTDRMTQKIIFIVGLGAPACLYSDYLEDLKKQFPRAKVEVLEWWNQEDFGANRLQSCMDNSQTILIGHSAGGTIALQAFSKWPELVKKVIMLDSHFLRKGNALSNVSRALDSMISKANVTTQNRVKEAYAPILKNDIIFNKALTFAMKWVNEHFDRVCPLFNTMPVHSGLHVGFTNSSYDLLGEKDKKALLTSWEKFNVDVAFLPMGHFDLIDSKCATSVNQIIVDWI